MDEEHCGPVQPGAGSDETFRWICDRSAEGIMVAEEQSRRVVYANAAACRMFGYEPGEPMGMLVDSFHPADALPSFLPEFAAFAHGQPRAASVRCLRKNGSEFYADIAAAPVVIDGVSCTAGYFHDLTEARKAEHVVRAEASRYRALVETTNTGYVIIDEAGTVLDANDEYARLCGRTSSADVIGRGVLEWTAPRAREANARAVAECAARGFIRDFEIDYVDAAGRITPIEINATVVEDGGQRRILTLCRDISQRRAADRALRESEEMFRRLVDGAPDAVFVQTGGKISYVNSAACTLFGAASENDVLGTDMMERIHPDFHDVVRRRVARVNIERTKNAALEEVYVRLDGTTVPVEVTAVPVDFKAEHGALVFVRDITERKRTEEALHNAERLESVGVLAGGIAHDFNNLLTGIFGNVDVASLSLARGDMAEVVVSLGAVRSVLDRARALTRQLLTFARGGAPLRQPIDLGNLVLSAAKFALSGSNIDSQFDIAPDLWWCNADANQIAQVLDNIVINACQAMPGGGTLRVRACNVSIEPEGHAIAAPGPHVAVTISDTGSGIPTAILGQIFDPFFTTKPRGTGLGLATAYSIVRRHEGAIDVESTPGSGTTFRILLPALRDRKAMPSERPIAMVRGTGDVIVMDDEPAIVSMLTNMIAAFGFRAHAAANGEQAVRIMGDAAKAGTRVVLAILDLTVPGGRGGKEIVEQLRAIDPRLKVIVSSGYSEDPVMADPAKFGFAACLFKPYGVDDVKAVLGKVLGGG